MKVEIYLADSDLCTLCPLLDYEEKNGVKKCICLYFKKSLVIDSRRRVQRLKQCITENEK